MRDRGVPCFLVAERDTIPVCGAPAFFHPNVTSGALPESVVRRVLHGERVLLL